MMVSNGSRSISHDTNMQDYLLKFGWHKQFCRLNIVYGPLAEIGVKALYPFRRYISRLPDHGVLHKVQSVLFQEQLRRECINNSI
jgi:hypothetical protein